jgi:hypothetical protein
MDSTVRSIRVMLDVDGALSNLLGALPRLVRAHLFGLRAALVQLRLALQGRRLGLGELRRARKLLNRGQHDERLACLLGLLERGSGELDATPEIAHAAEQGARLPLGILFELLDLVRLGQAGEVLADDVFGNLRGEQLREAPALFLRVVLVLLRERQQRVGADLLLVLTPEQPVAVTKLVERPRLADHLALHVLEPKTFALEAARLFA